MVLWLPKFWRMDGRRQTGSSLSRVLKRMERLDGPHGMYGTVFGEFSAVVFPPVPSGPFASGMGVIVPVPSPFFGVLCKRYGEGTGVRYPPPLPPPARAVGRVKVE